MQRSWSRRKYRHSFPLGKWKNAGRRTVRWRKLHSNNYLQNCRRKIKSCFLSLVSLFVYYLLLLTRWKDVSKEESLLNLLHVSYFMLILIHMYTNSSKYSHEPRNIRLEPLCQVKNISKVVYFKNYNTDDWWWWATGAMIWFLQYTCTPSGWRKAVCQLRQRY